MRNRVEQWKANRAGIINFWYYDDEEFQFDNGRMLLRGSNGSGKSVTMQSLVPLLFDGDKRPQRLDPFGSRARKMESYLLSDGLDLDERTAYLFLEFAKPEAGRFLTIGMGMRARKNMAMQTWYFIVLDNRRIGHQYDISLYKEVGDKIPLTAKQLENKLGDGGELFQRQKDYKVAVNQHLFGYNDLTDFDELIELLLQIRSPKLSKEFKPTTLYEIMQNSLIALSDDDLRPMSEAIENMDEIKIKIDSLSQAKKALGRIESAYKKYNAYTLAKKAEWVCSSVQKQKDSKKQLKQLTQNINQQEEKLEQLTQMIGNLDLEVETLEKQRESLQQHDLSKLANEKVELDQKLTKLKEQLEKKEKQLEDTKQRERELQRLLKDKQIDLTAHKNAVTEYLADMASQADECQFDEHAFFSSEYIEQTDAPYNFSFHNNQVLAYKQQLKAGKLALEGYENKKVQYEHALETLDQATQAKIDQARKVSENEQRVNEIKTDVIEALFAWDKSNRVIQIPQSALQLVAERVYQYGEAYRFDEIMQPARDAYYAFMQDIHRKISEYNGTKDIKVNDIQQIQDEIDVIKAQKEPEPPREACVIKNRQRLDKANIPYLPLYKAIDFQRELDEEVKNHLEEALTELGLLDALIVDPTYESVVLKMDKGMADKYIFANPMLMSHNLSTYLQPEKQKMGLSLQNIDNVLQSILLNPTSDNVFIDETGAYGMGIVRGQTAGTRQSRFIGTESRKRYKAQLIAEKEADISALQKEIAEIDVNVNEQEAMLKQAEIEWENQPNDDALSRAYGEYTNSVAWHKQCVQAESEAREKSEVIYGQLKDAELEMLEKTKRIQLPRQSTAYGVSLDGMDEYSEYFQQLKLADKDVWHAKESLTSARNQHEQCLITLEEIQDDLFQLRHDSDSMKQRLVSIIKELELSDYQEVLDTLAVCVNRLKEIPQESRRAINEQARTTALIQQQKEMKLTVEETVQRLTIQVSYYENGFMSELSLGYVQDVQKEQSTLEQAKAIGQVYGSLLDEKQQEMTLRDDLQERLHREGGELAEYNLKRIDLFSEATSDDGAPMQRMDIVARMMGREVKFYELTELIQNQIDENSLLLDEQDRLLFEEILIKSVSRKISDKIYHSEQWVKKIDALMRSMNTSSGLTFGLKWVTKRAETEDQLSTKELVNMLKGEQTLLTTEQRERLINHFRSKIQLSKNRLEDEYEQRSFLALMKEVLDYRKWFEFQLSYTKEGERTKELTNNAFYTFSGGEKAMAMYVPLFSAVYAKYQGGRDDCPKLISLDEAFAGVDEKNIEDMFRLLVELDLSFVANSQVLFGDYKTVPALAIYELIRPENTTVVTLIQYRWNGVVRELVIDPDE